ncbi:hypothetical protein IA933_03975 [Listeria marthii]|uniref:hypothetical protein n=1 Tax=Listeria marthii TaxID=529731 RepID=UPI00188759D4|nr:hypothetical protein [Listeria marthii]MBF2588051.1 hypothetical protein [Listeria marthii]
MSIVVEQLVIKDTGERWGSPYLLEQIKSNVATTKADFVMVCSESEQNILSQIQDYIARFSDNMTGADIHLFNQNPVFVQHLRKLPNEDSYEMTDTLQFLDESIPTPTSTYLERDPHVLLEEVGQYILYNVSFLKAYFEKAESNQYLIDVFHQANMVWKHSVLEETPKNEAKIKIPDDYLISDMVDCWSYYRNLENNYTTLSLELLDFDKNLFNYLIRTKLGPIFQKKLLAGDLAKATDALEALTAFLEANNKRLVSELVSLGYFYIQVPVKEYPIWGSNKPFGTAYLKFLKVLFEKMHYQTKQYNLAFYRRTTNAVYKAVGLNSLNPIAKCHKMYF